MAATGVLRILVKDVNTHYALQANIILGGTQSLSVQTDDAGRVVLSLEPGEYLIEATAPSHKAIRTHTSVHEGDNNIPMTIFLDPESLPVEELPETLSANVRPGFTLLHGYIVDAETGKPVSSVKVRMDHANVKARTDSKGHYLLSVPTPVPQYPGGLGTDTLIIEKEGYSTEEFDNFGVGGDAMGGHGLEIEKGSQIHKHDATHKLLKENPTSDTEEPQSAKPALKTPKDIVNWLSVPGIPFSIAPTGNAATNAATIAIPSSIRVGTGGSSTKSYQPCASKTTCTNEFTYSLESYVANGLPGEWIATWNINSLKAGAVAYRSYGANFVLFPVDPKGLYDICNTTACQVYDPWDKPTTSDSLNAASQTAGVVMTFGTVIFRTEYAAESNLASDTQLATCPDGQVGEPTQGWPCMLDPIDAGKSQTDTHSRGMCQRGSQRWASGKDSTGAAGDTGATLTTPRDWRCILDHYYNANTNSITVDPNGTGNPGVGTGNRTAFTVGEPTYGTIAYEAYESGITGIRSAAAADGSGDRPVVAGNAFDPSWELGGNRLAYSNGIGIAIVNADGTGMQQLTSKGCSAGVPTCDFAPSWSPSTGKIAFCSLRAGGNTPQIWQINPDGSGLQQLTTNLNLYVDGYEAGGNSGTEEIDCNLRWNPHGTQIAFTGFVGTTYANVFTMNADGSNVAQLTSCVTKNPNYAGGDCFTPTWTPDGQKLIFSDDNTIWGDNLDGSGIYTIFPDGTGLNQVYSAPTWHTWWPRYSTDGSKIFFTSNPSSTNGYWGVWSMNSDGSGVVEVVGGGKKFPYQSAESMDCSICGSFGKL
jgi:Tol biopolymer transport system component